MSDRQYTSIRYEPDDNIVIIYLDRPERMNAISRTLEDELHEALARADDDPQIRAIVLTGVGRAFSSGYDLAGDSDDAPGPHMADTIRRWHRRSPAEIDKLRQIWDLRTPLIAAVHGYCMGGGFWYSLAADITIAAESATFGQPEVRGTSSTTYLFAALAGWKVANRYALTGDHFDAAEALRIGVVNEVVADDDLMPAAVRLAKRIALVPEPSVRINRAITMQGLRAAGLDAGLVLNGVLNALVHSSYGPVNEDLNQARGQGGLKAMLELRDGPFRPEPFGPKSHG